MSSRLDYASSRLVTPGEIITRETGFMRYVLHTFTVIYIAILCTRARDFWYPLLVVTGLIQMEMISS